MKKFRRALRDENAGTSSNALLTAEEKEDFFHDELIETPRLDNEIAGCFGYDADDLLNDLDDLEDTDHRDVSNVVQHVNEDGSGDNLIPLFHTSALLVTPNLGLIPWNMIRCNDVNEIDDLMQEADDAASEDDEQDNPGYYLGYPWDKLPSNAKLAAETLGYNAQLWDNDEKPPAAQQKWTDLTAPERAGCVELGFDRCKWDGLPGFDDDDWNKLPHEEISAFKKLAYTSQLSNSARKTEAREASGGDLISDKGLSAFQLMNDQKVRDDDSAFDSSLSDGGDIYGRDPSSVGDVEIKGSSVLSKKGSRVLSDVLLYNSESRQLVRLSIPATAASVIAPILDGVIKAMVVGHLGPSLYLGWIMANFFLDWSDAILQGVANVEEILNVQAVGMKKYFLAGQYTQLTVTLYALTAIPSYLICVLFADEILVRLGLGNELAELSKGYIPFAAASRLLHGCCAGGIERLMWSEERGRTMVIIEIYVHMFKLVGVVAVLVGVKSGTIVALGVVELCSAVLCTIVVYWYCEAQGWLAKYKMGLYGHLAIRNTALVKGVLKMAAPLTLGHIFSQGEWQLLTLFAAYMGPAETIAWTIAESLWLILKEFPAGMRDAAEIRVGRNLGIGRPGVAKVVAYKSLFYSFCISVFTSTLLILIRKPLIERFTQEETLYEMVDDLVALLCTGNMIMSLGSGCHAILGTQRKAKFAALISCFGTLFITVPLATGLVFWGNYGLESMMMACVVGYSIISFVMLSVVFTTNWPRISRRVILKSFRDNREIEALMNKNSHTDFSPAAPDAKESTDRLV
jgi:Na+-driven multidrug efflux pump